MKISDLGVMVDGKQVLHAVFAEFVPSRVYAFMGPNGSGKSSLAKTIMAHPAYEITNGCITLGDTDLATLQVHERSKAGLFLSFQQPVVLPGVGVVDFLKEMYDAHGFEKIDMNAFVAQLMTLFKFVGLDQSFLYRNMHEGFSGGEQKRLEIVQMMLIKPKIVILDEIDSGLDVDALQAIGKALLWHKKQYPQTTFIIITHYARILQYMVPDEVLVLVGGAIVERGTKKLADHIDQHGYASYVQEATK